MPQMMPMLWMYIFIYMIIIFLIFKISIYFMPLHLPYYFNLNKSFKLLNKKWSWKW